jgi:hypothetical protein
MHKGGGLWMTSAIDEKAQVILVLVKALHVGNAFYLQILGFTKVRPSTMRSL